MYRFLFTLHLHVKIQIGAKKSVYNLKDGERLRSYYTMYMYSGSRKIGTPKNKKFPVFGKKDFSKK